MSFPRILILILCFFLDVHVRAEVLEATKAKRTVELEGVKLNLDKNCLVERKEGAVHLVRGQLLVESEKIVQIKTPFVHATCEGDCVALFQRAEGAVVIQSLRGDWTYKPVGDAQAYALPVATQIRLGEVTPDGVAERDFPQGLPWQSTLKDWAHLFSGPPEKFKSDVKEFREVWSAAIEVGSERQRLAAENQVKKHDREAAASLAAKAREERENEALRAMFRAKNQLD